MSTEALRRLTATEFTLFLRDKIGPIFGVLFPVALLCVFGNLGFFTDPANGFDGQPLLYTYVPILVAFVIAMLALNTLPPTLAGYREHGVLRRLRTTPVGPARVLAAQLTICFVTGAVAVVLLLAVALVGFDVPLPRQPAAFALTTVLAALALIGIAVLIAAVAPTAKTANATGSVLFYVLSFFAGLWLPLQAMPSTLRHVSEAMSELARLGVESKVLVLTTYDTDSYVMPAIEAGATGYLLKDAPRDELLRAVRSAARGEAVLAPSVASRLMHQVRQPGAGPLSDRELQVLTLVSAGRNNREAAAALFISEATVKTHLLNIYAKLGVSDRAAAVAEAFHRGLLTPGK